MDVGGDKLQSLCHQPLSRSQKKPSPTQDPPDGCKWGQGIELRREGGGARLCFVSHTLDCLPGPSAHPLSLFRHRHPDTPEGNWLVALLCHVTPNEAQSSMPKLNLDPPTPSPKPRPNCRFPMTALSRHTVERAEGLERRYAEG